MKELFFKNIEEFCEEYNDKINELKDSEGYVEVLAKYDDAKAIVRELIYYGCEIGRIEIEDSEFDGYNDEFCICVIDNEIYCCKAKNKDSYIYSDALIVYFMEDVNQKAVFAYKNAILKYIVEFEDENRDQDDEIGLSSEDSDVKIVKEKDGIHGFTVSKADDHNYSVYSFYSSDAVDKKTMDYLFDIFNI